jgi:hypothetical protein
MLIDRPLRALAVPAALLLTAACGPTQPVASEGVLTPVAATIGMDLDWIRKPESQSPAE